MKPSSDDGSLPGALAGVKVVEFAQAMAVPVCGQLLADMGAEVIKVEPPAGDAFRHTQAPVVPNESKGYIVLNRGKRGVCLDVTRPEAAPVVEKLVRWADVVLVSLKPSDLPRYGLTYDHLAAINPPIIYLDHIPNGPEGPVGQDGGYDVIVQGRSGIGAITARANGDAPISVRPAYMDTGTGFLSALAVVAALRHRDRTGEGQRVQTSLLSTALALGNQLISWFAATDPPIDAAFARELAEVSAAGGDYEAHRAVYEKHYLRGGYGNIYFRHYRSKDGFVSVGCLSPVLNARFRKVTGVTDPRQTPGFDGSTPEGYDALTALLRTAEDLFKTRTTHEWIDLLRAGGVPCGPFNFPSQVWDDEQILANEFVVELEHPLLGAYKTFAPPIRMDRTPTRIRSSSPLLDADTDAVLAEIGFAGAEIASLRATGVTGAESRP
jgi:formyl-CoA transferase